MGRRDLSEVFARAGVRFAELPEFLEEKHEWDKLDPPVELLPNSRFGVGVLSYFMMADEISIDTCRLGRSGQPGERLHVSIACPGSLFRIPAAGTGQESGTTVRLYLNAGAIRLMRGRAKPVAKARGVRDRSHREQCHGEMAARSTNGPRQIWLFLG